MKPNQTHTTMNHLPDFETYHCVDDDHDPITEEILDANHHNLPHHMRHNKELSEKADSLAMDEYQRVFDATGSHKKAQDAFHKRYQLLMALHRHKS